MKSLGKCLSFYYKYQPEMVEVYWNDNDQIVDAETYRMTHTVGEQCCQEAKAFLQLCAELIVDHFKSIGECRDYGVSSKTWTVRCGVAPANKLIFKDPKKARLLVGVELSRKERQLVVWLWGSSKKNCAEQIFRNHLGAAVITSSKAIGMRAGTVALAVVPVNENSSPDGQIDADKLLSAVKEAIAPVDQQKLDVIYALLPNAMVPLAGS